MARIAGQKYYKEALTSSSSEDGLLFLLPSIVCDTVQKSHDYELYMDICLCSVSSDLGYELVINSLAVLLGRSDNTLLTTKMDGQYCHRLWVVWDKESIEFELCLRHLKHGASRFRSKIQEVNAAKMNGSNQKYQNPYVEALQQGCAHSLLKHFTSSKYRNLEDFERRLRVCTVGVHVLLITQEDCSTDLPRELLTELQVKCVPK